MANFCSSCGGPLVAGQPHKEFQHMSWFNNKHKVVTPIDSTSITPNSVSVEPTFQANDAGDFFCSYCGWSWLATWSHAECEMRMLEAEGDIHYGL